MSDAQRYSGCLTTTCGTVAIGEREKRTSQDIIYLNPARNLPQQFAFVLSALQGAKAPSEEQSYYG